VSLDPSITVLFVAWCVFVTDHTDTPQGVDGLRLLREILDVHWKEEVLHAKDCPACDLAANLAGTLGAAWDPDGRWDETPVTDGLPGDSMLDQATRIAAWVLHRDLLGQKPSLMELERRHAERNRR
jgi:hypothetical protein